MSHPHQRTERHRQHSLGWLRASVLGANDGLISTASLLVGVAASDAARSTIIKTGIAALAAGALSMGIGEYVSVSAQADAEAADIEKERQELVDDHDAELHELAAIYRGRGLSAATAKQVAVEMHAHDALAAHLRDELSITEFSQARPIQAALSSSASFAVGATIALLAAILAPSSVRILTIAIVTLTALAGLGILSARLGDARASHAAMRVLIGGALAMAVTALLGKLIGASI